MADFFGRDLLSLAEDKMRKILGTQGRPFAHRISRTPGHIVEDLGMGNEGAAAVHNSEYGIRVLPSQMKPSILSHEAAHALMNEGGLTDEQLRSVVLPGSAEEEAMNGLDPQIYDKSYPFRGQEAFAYTIGNPRAENQGAVAALLQRRNAMAAERYKKLRQHSQQLYVKGLWDKRTLP